MSPRPFAAAVAVVVLATPAPASAAAFPLDVELLGTDGESAVVEEFHPVFPQDVTATWFDATFGYRKPSGRRHLGVDLMAPKMTPVYAVADGVITRRGHGGSAGNHLIIDHGGGWESWYMHLNNDSPGTDDGRAGEPETFAANIEEGGFVTAGSLLGFVGDSGNAEGTMPHTHFELHHNGRPVDPHPYLVEARDRAVMAWHDRMVSDVIEMLDPQLRAAASSSSTTLAATTSVWLPGSTVAVSSVAVGGASPATTQIDR